MKKFYVEKLGELKAIREAYGDFLLEIGEDERVVVIDCDLGHSTKAAKFAKRFPERYVEIGIQEQNMIGMAAGLAAVGKIPFTSTFAIFAVGRPWEQIRLSVAYSNFNVKIVATHAGVATGEDGASHQMAEDLALMGAIPQMRILSPSDYYSAKSLLKTAYEYEGYIYVRLVRPKTPTVYSGEFSYQIGEAHLLKEGRDVAVISTGLPVHHALKAAWELEREGVSVAVYDFLTVKPLDEEAIMHAANTTGRILVVEDHVLWGGLGMAISSLLARKGVVIPLDLLNLGDKFGRSGKYEDLYRYYGLDSDGIKVRIKSLLR
ncbi:MAG: transketolase family protein [Thermotogae bacterium]|nr:transketolase family protein [Thermotogota bacterium]